MQWLMNANEESQTQLTHPRFQVLQIASYADTHHHRLIQTKPRMNNNFVAKDQWEFKKGKLKKGRFQRSGVLVTWSCRGGKGWLPKRCLLLKGK